MPLVPVTIPPGIVRAGTEYMSRGRWYDASLVRWFAGTTQPVGGWVKHNPSSISGRPCALFGWRPNSGVNAKWLAVGTHTNIYAFDGAAVTDITPSGFTAGDANATNTAGYGGGLYDAGLYGTARTSSTGVSPVDAWHLDAWGQNLVACYTADGRLLEWSLNTANDLAVISGAPTDCKGLVVSAERMLFALAAGGDDRKLQWSDEEDNTTWTPAAANTAGSLLLTTDGKIITAERVRGGILVHTDTDAHLVSYVGQPFYYGVERVGDNCGIVSANAKVATASITAWMSTNGFYLFDGYVKPIPCDVHDYVFSNITRSQISKVAAFHNGEWGEIWWFYPADGASENNRYVAWNYREGHWSIGALARSAGIDKGTWTYPICAAPTGDWFEHENGWTDNGTERTSLVYLESGPTELVPGERLTWLNQVIHDESESANRVRMRIKTKLTPEGTETSYGPYTLSASSGYTDVRAQGRSYKLRFEETTSGQWKLGTMRVDVQATGRR